MFNCLNFVVGEDINNIHQQIETVTDNIIRDSAATGLEADREATCGDTSRMGAIEIRGSMTDRLKNATLTVNIIISAKMIDQIGK